jgi:hypothetical protein
MLAAIGASALGRLLAAALARESLGLRIKER